MKASSSVSAMCALSSTPIMEVPKPLWAQDLNMTVLVKDEGARVCPETDRKLNPTGTWKDRKATLVRMGMRIANQEMKKRRETVGHVSIVSSGNAALSLTRRLNPLGYTVHVLLTQMQAKVRDMLVQAGADVQYLEHSTEWMDADAIAKCFGIELPEHMFHVTMGFHAAYRTIVMELSEQLEKPPTSILYPIGTGEAGLGIMQQVEDFGWEETRVIGIRDAHNPHIGGEMDGGVLHWMAQRSNRGRFGIADIDPSLTAEQIQSSVPAGIRSEPAAAAPFAWMEHPFCKELCVPVCNKNEYPACVGRLVGKRPVIINSGYGMLQEALDQSSAVTS